MPHKQKTPGAVITAGVLLTIYGSSMLICGICGGAGLFINNPEGEAMMKDVPGYAVVKFAEPISNLLVAIVMIAAGVGLFQLMAFARVAAYLVCVYQILFSIVRTIHSAIFIIPVMDRLFAQQMQNQPQPPPFDMGGIMKGSMWGGLALNLLFHLVLGLTTLLFLSVKSSRDAFAGIGPVDDRDDGDRGPRRYEGYDDDDDYPSKSPPKHPGDTGIKGEG